MILSTSEYIRGDRPINDPNFYEPLADDPTVHHTQIVISVLKDLLHEGRITANEHKLMKPVQPSPGHFNMLPKIHKPGNPGRPIISGIGTVTEPISGYVDSLIKHIPTSLDSYITDTTHFLREISNLCIPKDSYLVTLDVSSLYTNIPHDDAISSLIDMYSREQKFAVHGSAMPKCITAPSNGAPPHSEAALCACAHFLLAIMSLSFVSFRRTPDNRSRRQGRELALH